MNDGIERREAANHEALWREMQAIEAVIRADASAAYHREMARASEASAHYVVTQIWPESRREELEGYRLKAAGAE